jgi:uncharacterized membrane protein YeiH
MSNFFYFLELLGLIAFALSGISVAITKKYDLLGIFVIAFSTSLGRGTLRDFLLGDLPVNWMRHIEYIYIIFFVIFISKFFLKKNKYLKKIIFLFDTIGLGIFTLIGIEKGLAFGFNPTISVLLGTITATFGGVIRDILCREKPILFKKELHGTICIAGGISFFILKFFKMNESFIYIFTLIWIILLRWLSLKYKLDLPVFFTKEESKNLD